MGFEFATATSVLFGPGTRHVIPERAKQWGTSALVVTGSHAARAQPLVAALEDAGISSTLVHVATEPTVDDATRAAARARAEEVGLVIGIGGGSVLDLGKAVAALLTNPGDPTEYLEVVGRGQPLRAPSAPYIAVPTTAGTGAEVTRNAVLAVPGAGVKVSMRSELMLPRLAVIDPELTLDLPPALTAATGMDALTQLIEPFLSVRANPMTDALCQEGIPRIARHLPRACADGSDLEARTEMSLASLFGGLALANSGLGAVHGLAAPVGGRFPAPHGAVCAALLPSAMRVNLRALRSRAHDSPALARLAVVAHLLTGDPSASADEAIDWLEQLRTRLGIPGLSSYGVTAADADALVSAASRSSSMRGNCIALEPGELHAILAAAM